MACYSPVPAWMLASGEVVFVERGDVVRALDLPCGRCVGCRLERSRQWAVRCVHEASLHEDSMFITLTYSDDKLPPNGSLRYRDVQLWLKRLRKKFAPKKVRFFCSGEYGDELGRPHYHVLLFGLRFSDLVEYKRSHSGDWLYTSKESDALWTLGRTMIGEVTFESAAYTARYIMKKVTGDAAQSRYEVVSQETGEVVRLEPEFARMSLNPGIGKDWVRLYWPELVNSDAVVVNGVEASMPRYYRRYLQAMFSDEVLHKREVRCSKHPEDFSRKRLEVRERVAKARIKLLKRGLS